MVFGGETVTSRQNKYVSEACSLDSRKQRDKLSLFRFDGVKLMCEAVRKGVVPTYVIMAEGAVERLFQRANELYGIDLSELDCRLICVSDSLFEKISDEKAPEGVICVAKYIDKFHKIAKIYSERSLPDRNESILLLEAVRDPSNVGAIIRSAAAFGVDRVIMGVDCADIYNAKTLRSSMGALFDMRIDRVDDLVGTVSLLRSQGRHIYAAALDENAAVLGKRDILGQNGDWRAGVIIGNEGHGLSRELIDACDGCVFIPMTDKVESLNASAAAAVLMWEFFGRTE